MLYLFIRYVKNDRLFFTFYNCFIYNNLFNTWSDGISYIVSSKRSSKIALKPLAPVFLLSASLAIAIRAFFLIVSFTPSIAKNCWNCLTTEFFGFVRISTKASSSSSSKEVWTAKRPTNSGINPNLIRSSGSKKLIKLSQCFFITFFFYICRKTNSRSFFNPPIYNFPKPIKSTTTYK